MEQFKNTQGKDVELKDLVEEAASELLLEKRRGASSLIKNFLMKAEDLTVQVKTKTRELQKVEESLARTLANIEELKKGNWSILKENKGQSKVDSFSKEEVEKES